MCIVRNMTLFFLFLMIPEYDQKFIKGEKDWGAFTSFLCNQVLFYWYQPRIILDYTNRKFLASQENKPN